MTPLTGWINPQIVARVDELAMSFAGASPFPHIVLDDFLVSDRCLQLVREFPGFDADKAINEDGVIGGKAVHERVRSIGQAYRDLDSLVKGKPFRELIGRICGIADLNYDPYYFGGGTHENRHAQDLDPHVDFNYHPITNQHRRLNLIIYLNAEWHSDWGGSLDLHKNPGVPEEDLITSVVPKLNRAVIFETTENSWHGFQTIDLPPEKRGLSRQSFALYYYTRERPASETAPPHSTIYIERPLPGHIKAGHTLNDSDIEVIRNLLARRDQHLNRLYGQIQDLMTRFAPVRRLLAPIRRVGYWLRSR